MNTATVQTIHCLNGNQVRVWKDDTVLNVQLTNSFGAEMGRAQFTGKDAQRMAAMVGAAWQLGNGPRIDR